MDPQEIIRLLQLLQGAASGEMSTEDLREAAIRSTLDEVMAVEKLLDIQVEPGSYMLGSVLNEFGIGALVSESFREQARDSLAALRDAYIQKTTG
jgi:hypothetical protein